MKWSWKIGTFAGIAVYVHATFVLLLGWIALSHWMQYQSLLPTLVGVGFILALFLCVVLHEYGHALAARKFGICHKGHHATAHRWTGPLGAHTRTSRTRNSGYLWLDRRSMW